MAQDPNQGVPIPVGNAVPVAGGALAPPGAAPVPVAGGYVPGQQPVPVGGYQPPAQTGMMGMMNNFMGQPTGAVAPQPQYANGTNAVAPVPANYGAAPQQTAVGEASDYKWLAGHQRLLVKQRFEGLEALANAVGINVVEFQNKYDIYDANTGVPIMFAAEKSDCLCRMCCKPHHTATLNVYDIRQGVNQPIFNVDKPFKCNCFVCMDFCATEQNTVTPNNVFLGKAQQPLCCAGYFTPTLAVFAGSAEKKQDFKVVGPFCCIGGQAVESCTDQIFTLNAGDTDTKVGRIVKMKPEGMGDALKQFVGDNDNFLLELDQPQSAEQVATLAATVLLMDYIFFENEGGAQMQDGGIAINIANCYICGCVCPCNAQLGGPNSDF